MTAHWVVLAAAALTTLVAAAVGAALAVFAGQALPQAVRHDLVAAPGTALAATGSFGGGDQASTSAALRAAISGALSGVPFAFWSGTWSDPLGLVPGALPARPASAGPGTTPLLEAAALDGIASHAVLVPGSWPVGVRPARRRDPRRAPRDQRRAAAPARRGRAPACGPEHERPADLHHHRPVRAAPAVRRRRLLLAARPGARQRVEHGERLHQLRAARRAAVGVPRAAGGRRAATWVAEPDMGAFSGTQLSAVAAAVTSLKSSLASSQHAQRAAAELKPADGPRGHRQQPRARQVAARHQRRSSCSCSPSRRSSRSPGCSAASARARPRCSPRAARPAGSSPG